MESSIGAAILGFLSALPKLLNMYLEMRKRMSAAELAAWLNDWSEAMLTHSKATTDEERLASIKRIGDLARKAISRKGEGLG